MILSLKFTAIVALFSFLAGSFAGVYGTARLYNISAMRAKIVALQADKARYVKAIGLSKDIDAATSSVEILNEGIEAMIAEKIAMAVERAQSEKPKPVDSSCPVPVAGPSICIDADVLHTIGKLK